LKPVGCAILALRFLEHYALVRYSEESYERMDRFDRWFMPVLMAGILGLGLFLFR